MISDDHLTNDLNCESCALNQITEADVAPFSGLDEKDGVLCANKIFFKCCDARGEFFVNSNAVTICDLRWRIRAVQRIKEKYDMCWGAKNKFSLSKMKKIHTFNSFSGTGKISIRNNSDAPSHLWSLALFAAWHFGINCHVISFVKKHSGDLQPDDFFIKHAKNRTNIIFVEGINQLHDPVKAFDLETVVNYAYNANFKLYLDFLKDEIKADVTSKSKSKKYFSNRVSTLRNNTAKKFLSEDCVAKLETIYNGEVRI